MVAVRWLLCDCCGRDRRHSGGFLLRIMPPSWHPVPACTQRLCGRRAILRCRDNCCRRAILRCRYDCCRRNHSTLQQRRLDSDAERCCGGDRRHSGGFLLRIMPPSWHPVPACAPRLRCRRAILRCRDDCSRRNHSPSRKRRIESDAVRLLQAELFSAASIRKSWPEIRNRCTQEA